MTKISEYVNTVGTLQGTDLLDVTVDLGGGSWETQKLTWSNTITNIRTVTDTLLGGQALSATAQAPGAGQDGYSIVWNNTAGEYQLVAAAGGGNTLYTADDTIGAGVTRTVTIPATSQILFGGSGSLVISGANIPSAGQGGNVGVRMGTEKPLAPLHIGQSYNATGNGASMTPLTGHTAILQNNFSATDPSRVAIVSGANSFSGIDFGDSADIKIGRIFYNNGEDSMNIHTNNLLAFKIQSDQSIIASNLAGVGTRMVVADAGGLLSTQSITAGTGLYGGSGTIPTSVIATITDSLTFQKTGTGFSKLTVKEFGGTTGRGGMQFTSNTNNNNGVIAYHNNSYTEAGLTVLQGKTAITTGGSTVTGIAFMTNATANQDVVWTKENNPVMNLDMDSGGLAIGLGGTHAAAGLKLETSGGDVRFRGVSTTDLFYVDYSANNVGIGTSTPDASMSLDVIGSATFSVGVGAELYAIEILGLQRLFIHTGDKISENTFVGYQAGNTNPAAATGDRNTAFGQAALKGLTTATDQTAVGRNALLGITVGSHNTAIGADSLDALTAGVPHTRNTAVGSDSLTAITAGNNNTSIGAQSGSNITGGDGNTFVGQGTGASVSGTYNKSIAIGYLSTITADQQCVIGNSASKINDFYLGAGVSQTGGVTDRDTIIHATDASGLDKSGGDNLVFMAGRGTGTGIGGHIKFQTAAAGATSSTLNSVLTHLEITDDGNVIMPNLPTSSAGLPVGSLWNNSGVLNIV